jgi:hypothetical protein
MMRGSIGLSSAQTGSKKGEHFVQIQQIPVSLSNTHDPIGVVVAVIFAIVVVVVVVVVVVFAVVIVAFAAVTAVAAVVSALPCAV